MSDISPQLSYYKPSGSVPPGGAVITLAAGIAVGVIAGAIYGFANYHDPLIYINILLACVFGGALGYAVSRGVAAFHIRNAAAAGFMAVVVFIAAYASHWIFYLATVVMSFDNQGWNVPEIAGLAKEMVSMPDFTWDFLKSLNEQGVWSISRSGRGGAEVKGIILTGIWVAEAAVIGYYALSAPVKRARRPYSERRGAWMEALALPCRVGFIENADAFKLAISRGDYSPLTTPFACDEAEPAESKYAKVTLYQDPMEPFVDVENVTETVKKKKRDTSVKHVVQYLKITPGAAQKIKEALEG